MTSFSEIAAPVADKHLIHPKYRPDIDGLRAVAVLSVVFYHAFPRWVPGGFIGVDIFFIISGFLISTIIYGSLERQAFSFTEFYGRRIKRIFPALLLVLSACLAFGWISLYPAEYAQLGKHTAGGAGFISNFLLWDETGYFDTSAEVKPLLHLWSLGIEEQFYIAWPLILWAAWKMRLNVLSLTLAFLVVSFALNIFNISNDPSRTFYMPHTRAWELLTGSVLAYVVAHHGEQSAKASQWLDRIATSVLMRPGFTSDGAVLRNAQSIAGVLLLGLGFTFVTKVGFPGWQAIIPCAGAILIISAGPKAWINRNILGNKLMVWIGLISFPLYLWHWPILSFLRIIDGETPSRDARIIGVALAILLAWATYYLVERPLRKVTTWVKTVLLVAMMVLVGGVGYMTFSNGGFQEREGFKTSEEFNSQFGGALWQFTKNEICLTKYNFPDAKNYRWWFCMASKDAPPTLMLLGNSYANHLYPGLIETPETAGNSILSIGTCSPEYGKITAYIQPSIANPCSGNGPHRQNMFINDLIDKNPTIKTVIMDGLEAVPGQDYIERLSKRLEFLQGKGMTVILFTPHVTVSRDARACFMRPLKRAPSDCVIPISVREKIDGVFNPIKAEIQKRFPTVKFFDQNDTFCTEKKCDLVYEGMPVFRDESGHYTEFASKVIAAKFAEWAKVNAPSALIEE